MPDSSQPSATVVPDCPYRGLDPFSESDRRYFFGREEETMTIAANLLTAPMTVLYGASGVGKSSVIMAGVVPFLRQRNSTVVLFRSWQDRMLLPVLNETIAAAVKDRTGATVDTECGFDVCVASAVVRTHTRLTIIFDQFEESLLYHPSHALSGHTFDHQFARIVNRGEAAVNILISIREDWLAKLDRFQPHIPELMNNLLRLDHLDVPGARKAITRPLERFNEDLRQRGPDDSPYTIEPELINVVIEQVRTGSMIRQGEGSGRVDGTAGTEPESAIETPFLQMILTALWDAEQQRGSRHLRLETLSNLGGPARIVRSYVDDVVNRLTPRQQDICSEIFNRLVTPSGIKIAHSAEDLVDLTTRDSFEVREVLTALAGEKRVLREVSMPGVVRYEIFHDVLAQPVLYWRTKYVANKALQARAARRRRFWSVGLILLIAVGVGWQHHVESEKDAATHAKADDAITQAARFADRGLPRNAEQMLLRSVRMFRDIGDTAGVDRVKKSVDDLNKKGLGRVNSEEYSGATDFFRSAEAVARSTGDVRLRAECLLQKARSESLNDNDDDARKTIDSLERLARTSDVLSPGNWVQFGLLESTLGNPSAASNALDHALQEATRLNDHRVVAEALFTIANTQYDNGDFAGARNLYDKAATEARTSDEYKIEVRSVAQLVKVADKLNDTHARDKYKISLEALLSRQPERIRSVLKDSAAEAASAEKE